MTKLYVRRSDIAIAYREKIVVNAVNSYPVEFSFSPDWDDLDKTAVFKSGEVSRSVLVTDDVCVIPWEVIQVAGNDMLIGVVGTRNGEIILPTIWCNVGKVLDGAEEGEHTVPPTPDIYSQILSAATNAVDVANSVRSDADAGLFDGVRGFSIFYSADAHNGVNLLAALDLPETPMINDLVVNANGDVFKILGVTRTAVSLGYVTSIKGETGNGITRIEKTGSVANVDTYTIYMSDDTSYNFEVTNYDSSVISNIEERLSTAESDIDSVEEDVAGIASDLSVAQSDIESLNTDVAAIQEIIPAEASAENELADKNWVNEYAGKVNDVWINNSTIVENKVAKIIYETGLSSDSNNAATVTAIRNFVNSSINALAAYYITSNASRNAFESHAQLVSGPWYYDGSLRTPTKNDYAIVIEDEAHDDNTSRYVYGDSGWSFQYTFNMQFTQAQIDAINSGINATLIADIQDNIATNTNNIGRLALQKADKSELGDLAFTDYYTVEQADANVRAIFVKAENAVPNTRKINNKALSADITLNQDDVGDGSTYKRVTQSEKTSWNGKYTKPSGGIPVGDLSSSVQANLDKANTAMQGLKINSTELQLDAEKKANIVADTTPVEDSANLITSGAVYSAITGVAGAVKYSEAQSLTASEKSQARTNIDAAASSDIPKKVVLG